jgi:hypothetical protein
MNKNKLIHNDADLTRTGAMIAKIHEKIREKKSR